VRSVGVEGDAGVADEAAEVRAVLVVVVDARAVAGQRVEGPARADLPAKAAHHPVGVVVLVAVEVLLGVAAQVVAVGHAVGRDQRGARQDPPLDLGRHALHQAVAAGDVRRLVEQHLVEVRRGEAEPPAAGAEGEGQRAAVVDAVVIEADARVVVARVTDAGQELGEAEAEAAPGGTAGRRR
jgi:hypothetical protein